MGAVVPAESKRENIATSKTSPAITPYHTYHFSISALFPRSEAKGKLVLFRSQQRRLRLVLLQQRGNSSVICRALSRQLHIWIDQQRGNMLVFSLCSR